MRKQHLFAGVVTGAAIALLIACAFGGSAEAGAAPSPQNAMADGLPDTATASALGVIDRVPCLTEPLLSEVRAPDDTTVRTPLETVLGVSMNGPGGP